MSSTIGYARVSTTDQDLEIQITALKREGCSTIRSEKRSGTTTANREDLQTVLDFLREGDVLMVTRIDRLARSIGDLQDIVRAVRAAASHAASHKRHGKGFDGCHPGARHEGAGARCLIEHENVAFL
jgi:DNA invertase Pin-like site-specific DNA recombinase